MRNGATIAFAVLLSACGVHQESSLQDQTASPFTKLGKVPNSMGILARTSDRLINIGDGKYAASADSGITWSTEFPYSTPLWFEEGGTLSVANGVLYKATGSTLYLSKDQGASFQKPKTDGYCTSRTIRALPDSSLIFASNCGVLISDDQGRSFYAKTTENGLSGNTILDVISHQDTLFALVQNYYRTLNVSRDSGETWTTFDVNQTLKGSISAPYIGENEKGVYIAANGFFQSKDQGQTFTKLTEASFTAFAVAGDTIVGTTESGDIYLSSDSGITWAIRRIDGVQKAAAKVIIVDQNIYLFTRPDSSSNYFIFSNDNGITFQTSQFPTITGQINQITDIASAYGKVWVLTETASYISEDGGHTLNRLNTGVTVRAFTRITQSGNKVFVEAGCYGSSQTCTFVSSDGGKSYSYLRDSGIYSAYNQAFSGTILHGIVDGRLSYSTDEGKTWIKSVVPNTLYPSYASIQAAGSRSLVLTKDKGIYFSNNGGKKYMSWDNTAVDVGTVYRAALDDDKILISASKGIFSIDMASNSTTQIMDSSRFPQFYFDTAVATQNKIFLASSNGIAVSRDGGQNFSLYTTGLNRYDLQFHLFSDAEYYSTYGDLFQIQD